MPDINIRVFTSANEFFTAVIYGNDGYDAEQWARHAYSPRHVAFMDADNPGVPYVSCGDDEAVAAVDSATDKEA